MSFQGYRTWRILWDGISSLTENIALRGHRALRASFSLLSFLPDRDKSDK
jgi:hypothetical protein